MYVRQDFVEIMYVKWKATELISHCMYYQIEQKFHYLINLFAFQKFIVFLFYFFLINELR